MRWRFTLITAAIALTACDAGPARQESSVAASPSSTSRSTTSASSSSTSTSSTSTTSTTLAPTTTISLEEQVRADFTSAWYARRRCAYAPEACDFAAIAAPGSPMDVGVRRTMADRIEGNLRAVEGIGQVLWRIDRVWLVGERAFVATCLYDTIVLFDVQDPLDPTDDIVFDDSVYSEHVRWTMEPTPLGWRIAERITSLERYDEDMCGFSA